MLVGSVCVGLGVRDGGRRSPLLLSSLLLLRLLLFVLLLLLLGSDGGLSSYGSDICKGVCCFCIAEHSDSFVGVGVLVPFLQA